MGFCSFIGDLRRRGIRAHKKVPEAHAKRTWEGEGSQKFSVAGIERGLQGGHRGWHLISHFLDLAPLLC